MTSNGYKLVETLKDDDFVVTSDRCEVPIKVYSTVISNTNHKNAPYLIQANSFSEHVPLKDIILSPLHAIQVGEKLWQIQKKAAKNNKNIQQIKLGKKVEYFHIETPDYLRDNIIVEGSIVESYGINYINKHLNGTKVYNYDPNVKAYRRVSKKELELITYH